MRARADDHARHPALQDLRDAERAGVLGRRVEVGAVLVLAVRSARRDVEAEELLAGEELIARRDVDGAAHAQVHAVQRAFVANHEPPVAIEKVGVLRRDERIVGEHELAVATDHVLLGLQVKRQAVHPFSADEDELGLGRVLHVAEEQRSRAQDLGGDRLTATSAELVARAGPGSNTSCKRNCGPAP